MVRKFYIHSNVWESTLGVRGIKLPSIMDITDLTYRIRTATPNDVISQSQLPLSIVLSVIAVLTAEALLYAGYVWAAVWIHFLLFLGLSSALLVPTREASVLRAFLLLPLFRLLNLGMPVYVSSTLLWLSLIYGTLLIATYIIALDQAGVQHPSREDIDELLVYTPLAVVLAAILASIEFALIQPEALIQRLSGFDLVTLSIVMVGFVGFTEEFLFRGVLQGTLTERIGPFPAIILSALVFGAMHSSHGILAEVGFGVATGLLFGFLYHRTGNLLFVTLIHGTLNLFLFGLFPVYGLTFTI